MSLPLQTAIYACLVPAAVASLIVWRGGRAAMKSTFEPALAASAVAAAFLAGFALLVELKLLPQRHWQWLPALGILGMLVSLANSTSRPRSGWRLFRFTVLSVVAAWLLVPRWPNLFPPRTTSVTLLAVYLLAITILLDALPEQALGRPFTALLCLASFALAVVLAVWVSVTYAQLGLIVASALAAASIGLHFRPAKNPAEAARGLIPVYAVLIGGLAYIGCIEPDPPLVALLIVPAIPLSLWALAAPLRRN